MQEESEQVRQLKHHGIGAGVLAMSTVFLGTFLFTTMGMHQTAQWAIVASLLSALAAGIIAERAYLWFARRSGRTIGGSAP